jgi:hypothetical protein
MYFVQLIGKKGEVHRKFTAFADWMQGYTQTKLDRLQIDGGSEFKGDITKFVEKNGISLQVSVPNQQWQNGRAERGTDIIWRGATALLDHAHLPESMWPDAVKTFVRVRNMLPSKGSMNPKLSCYELFSGKKPNLAHTQIFGCVAWIFLPKDERDIKTKTSSRALKGLFIGYPDNMKGYIILDPLTMKRHNVAICMRFLNEFPGLDPKHFKTPVYIPDFMRRTPEESTGDNAISDSTGDNAISDSTGDNAISESTGDNAISDSTGDNAISESTGDNANTSVSDNTRSSSKRQHEALEQCKAKRSRIDQAPAAMIIRPKEPGPWESNHKHEKYAQTLNYCLLNEATADAAIFTPKTYRQALACEEDKRNSRRS